MVSATARGSAWARTTLWLALLFLFSLPAFLPLLTSTPTRSADGILHLYRLVELDTLWRAGVFWTRWLPDLAFGYGMPLFNYYAPLAYYLTTPLHVIGVSFTLALNLSLTAALYLGGVGVFFFARALYAAVGTDGQKTQWRESGTAELGAFVAALAYVYAPYLLFNALDRASLGEAWALAFAPFALWRWLELTRTQNARNWILAVVLTSAVLGSHNVTGFLFTPLLLGFGGVAWWAQGERSLRAALVLVAAFGVALAGAAFFWLPALLERDLVQIVRVIVTPDFDYRFHFVAPSDLIALLPRTDTGRLNPSFPDTLGAIQVLLGVVGVMVLVTRLRTRRTLAAWYLLVGGLALVGLMLSISQPIWDHVSLLAFIQLPMRLRGLVALCVAPLCGLGLLLLPTQWRLGATAFAAIALGLSAFGLLYPQYAHDVPSNPTLADMNAYEAQTGAIGTTSFGEYLPIWVENIPNKSPFADAYRNGEIPKRFEIPQGVNMCGENITRTVQAVCVSAPVGWRAIAQTFYFPGWQAQIGTAAVEARPTLHDGLVTFDVPAGKHTLTLAYVGTPLERAADWISIAAAIGVVGVGVVALLRGQRRRDTSTGQIQTASQPASHSARRPAAVLAMCALALIGFKFFYTDRQDNPLVAHYDGAHVKDVQIARQAAFGNELELLGFDINGIASNGGSLLFAFKRGETLRAALDWRALRTLDRDLSVFVHLTAADGTVVAQKDNLHPGNLPTTRWDTATYVQDVHAFEIPPTLAAGNYDLDVGVYDPTSGARLTTSEGGDSVLLAKIQVTE